MYVRKVILSVDECSEIRCVLKHKINDINSMRFFNEKEN